jgi:hypothetical protein
MRFTTGRAHHECHNRFNNQAGVDRPFVNANQWGASFGGSVVKDKTFFFINTEGLRVLLPTSTRALIPSPEYQSATLANLATVSPESIPFHLIFTLHLFFV